MKFFFENLALLHKTELNLNNLTIICGNNNTGKTYVTYAIYGFLRNWNNLLSIVLRKEREIYEKKKRNKSDNIDQIDLQKIFEGNINKYLQKMCDEYLENIHRIFASKEDYFKTTKLKISIEKEANFLAKSFSRRINKGDKVFATLSKKENSGLLEILTSDDTEDLLKKFHLNEFIIDAVSEIVFEHYFPRVHISSAERTGATIFRTELDIARTRMLKALNEIESKDLQNPLKLLEQIAKTDYALPVEDNVSFVRQLEDFDKQVSDLYKENPKIKERFNEIIGGDYKVIKNKGLVFQPQNDKKKSFSMNEVSSCARALLDIGFYIRCRAKPGDLFIIDEPELNLHPKNQLHFARLIVLLINSGIKVFMTTHSDYLIKELNTMIIFNRKTEHTKKIQGKYGYSELESLDPSLVNLYITDEKSISEVELIKANINSEYGIEVNTFDKIIETMNEIQDELIYGG